MIVQLREKSQITIPAKYIKQLSLSIGDKLEVTVQNGTLLLTPVSIHSKNYIECLETDVVTVKKQISSGNKPTFQNIDNVLTSLDEK